MGDVIEVKNGIVTIKAPNRGVVGDLCFELEDLEAIRISFREEGKILELEVRGVWYNVTGDAPEIVRLIYDTLDELVRERVVKAT